MKKKKLWGFIAGAVVIAITGSFALNQGIKVDAEIVKKGSIAKYIEEVGTVKSRSLETVCIEGNGLIRDISVEVGQKVTKGQLLLVMDQENLQIQQKNAEQKINEIKASYQGSEIKNYSFQLDKAKSALKKAQADYDQALNDRDNAKMLVDAGAASLQELKVKDTALESAQTALNTSQNNLKALENDTPASDRDVYQAQLEQAELNLKNILLSIKKQEVVSPINGVVLEKKVEVNTVAVTGMEAFTIGDVEDMEIEAYILADDAVNIHLGDEVKITERSEKKQEIKGVVSKIAPSAIEMTSSLGVKQKKVLVTISMQDIPAEIKPGYEVDVVIITQEKDNVIIVPLSSVFDYKNKSCVFVDEQGKATLKTVQKGIENDSIIEITDGIKEGEWVLSNPDSSIEEGKKIKLDKSGQ